MTRPRVVLASCSVALVALVVITGALLGPEGARTWLLVCGGAAVFAAVQAASSNPADLTPTLVLALPPVLGLLVGGSPAWLIGPLGALLLAASELNALAWECGGADALSAAKRRRLVDVIRLVALGAGASLLVGLVA
ncbi:MAG TPA: hypothetical protein VKZ85_00655 [Woeseiaceae bacterium]|nr:hypothetical protein [Woeseiaceae bacterium]